MKTRIFKLILCISVLLFSFSCKKPFEHDAISDSPTLLVVEGIINQGGQTNILISRTLKLSDKSVVQMEKGAKVQVEGSNNTILALTESSAGIYTLPSTTFNTNLQYRLRIKTIAGKEYLSDLMSVRSTPAIDSLNWRRERDGVGLYIDAHDSNNNTKYYQWDYLETWEQHSVGYSDYVYKNNIVQNRDYLESLKIFTCWKNEASTNILISSTAKLSSDVVDDYQLALIPNRSERLGVRYSILVRQYAIGREAYEYLTLMKRNSEQMGSIFDNQPSDLVGNIQCVSNPNERVIGFINISQIVEKRIFINNNQVPAWNFNLACEPIVVRNHKDSLYAAFVTGMNLITTYNLSAAGTIESYNGNTSICLDCRTRGGSNVKPAFW
ncbi:MAG: DUF4249 domain-containing protein [Daejeonella sp.]|uniref:DUF4249 domain-containing protein n=1 Tax=Daejeonella sp. TaxID=2805397 RepID=UPI0027363533|nr:DUF4249 domain-containing protein [Daejeonella sp.]MDP3467334.1 DUF4249 domain-containing protein [Daejeonella sp.]